MVENEVIQQTGFHNLAGKDGKIWGFQFGMITLLYRGMFLSQMRWGKVTVDGEIFPKESLIIQIQDVEYTPEEMYDLDRQYWQLDDVATVKVPKPGGLKVGYHDVTLDLGWVNVYGQGPEIEADGSGLGNAAPRGDKLQTMYQNARGTMSGGRAGRRLLLVW